MRRKRVRERTGRGRRKGRSVGEGGGMTFLKEGSKTFKETETLTELKEQNRKSYDTPLSPG